MGITTLHNYGSEVEELLVGFLTRRRRADRDRAADGGAAGAAARRDRTGRRRIVRPGDKRPFIIPGH